MEYLAQSAFINAYDVDRQPDLNQGSGNPNLTASVDALSIGTGGDDGSCITYNFDPYRVATSKEQCKNGGYNGVGRADGSTFKNQGDCVSYASNGK